MKREPSRKTGLTDQKSLPRSNLAFRYSAAASSSGFSLLELLLALTVLGITLAAIFSSLARGQNISLIAKEENEIQQNLQDALTLMSNDLRTAGFPPETYYEWSYLQQPATPKNLVTRGLIEIGPQSLKFHGDINGNGKTDFVSYSLSGSSLPFFLNRYAGEIRPDGSLPGGSPQKLSDQVEFFQFRYYDHVGAPTSNPAAVVTIEIRLVLRTRSVDPYTGIYHTVSQSTTLRPRNL